MSVISENLGGPDAPELMSTRHACGTCRIPLAGIGRWIGLAHDYCDACGARILALFRDSGFADHWWPDWTHVEASKPGHHDGR